MRRHEVTPTPPPDELVQADGTFRDRIRPLIECRAIVGVDKQQSGLYVTVCSRFRGHFGKCQAHTRHSQIESFYEINRRTWPDMSRFRALWSAWRTWQMTKKVELS